MKRRQETHETEFEKYTQATGLLVDESTRFHDQLASILNYAKSEGYYAVKNLDIISGPVSQLPCLVLKKEREDLPDAIIISYHTDESSIRFAFQTSPKYHGVNPKYKGKELPVAFL